MIEIDGLWKRYGDKVAVRDLTLTVAPGSLVCLLGPNGAGKTSTIHVLAGLKNPSAGDVRLLGTSVRSPGIHATRRRLGYLAEQPHLYDDLTGREFLEFVAELYEVDPAEADLDAWLARFDMSADADALIRTYSMGMRKKIAFLAAVLPRPDVLVLDEPTGGLDAVSARAVKDLMVEARDQGRTVLFTTHVMEIAERLADRVVILDHGTKLFDGSVQELTGGTNGRRPGRTLEEVFIRMTTERASDAVGVGDPADPSES